MDWRERWVTWRNRRLADPAFLRLATRFLPTRPVAQAQARALFDVVAGFVYSQVAFACVELGLLDRLAAGPMARDAAAAACDLPAERMQLLLDAAAALDLVELLPGSRCALGSAGAALVSNPGIAAMIRHHRPFYADLADPVALLRAPRGTAQLAGYWNYTTADAASVADYSALMAASQPMLAGLILDAYPFARHRRLLDIAGGEGAFVEAVAVRVPGLALGLFDLPPVAERAAVRLGATATVYPGSFIDDPLPRGADLVTLVRVVHDHDDAVVAALFAKIRALLPRGGTLLIAEPMAEARGAAPIGAAYFGFYLLAMGSGRPRSAATLHAMLQTAGFARVRRHRSAMPMLVDLISAVA